MSSDFSTSFKKIYLCLIYLGVLCACKSELHMHGSACKARRGLWIDALGPRLQMVVSHHVDYKNQTWILKSSQCMLLFDKLFL